MSTCSERREEHLSKVVVEVPQRYPKRSSARSSATVLDIHEGSLLAPAALGGPPQGMGTKNIWLANRTGAKTMATAHR